MSNTGLNRWKSRYNYGGTFPVSKGHSLSLACSLLLPFLKPGILHYSDHSSIVISSLLRHYSIFPSYKYWVHQNNLGHSPHLKVLNLITNAKSLLPYMGAITHSWVPEVFENSYLSITIFFYSCHLTKFVHWIKACRGWFRLKRSLGLTSFTIASTHLFAAR